MSASARSGLRTAGLIVGGIGLALGLAGAAVAYYIPPIAAAEHARLVALPAPDAIALSDTPAGREVIVEGRIAPDQPVLFRDFVAYVKEEERRDRSDRDRTEWKEVERRTPPLQLLVGDDDGRVHVVNRDYAITWAKRRWSDTSRVLDTAYSGLVAREAVFVRGRTADGGTLEAITVGSGTRAAYLEQVAGNAGVAWWLGVGFVILGTCMVALAVVLFVIAVRRGRSHPWQRPARPAAR